MKSILTLMFNNKLLLAVIAVFLYLFISNKYLSSKVENLEAQLSGVRYELIRASEEADKLKQEISELTIKAQLLFDKQQEIISKHEEELSNAIQITKDTECGSSPLDNSVLELLRKPHD